MGLVVIAIFIIIVVLTKMRSQRGSSSDSPRSLEEKLGVLRQCGVVLSPSFTTDDMLASFDRSVYEDGGWNMVLTILGSESEDEDAHYQSKNLLYLDTECIEDDGDYARIVSRMADMTQGSLPLADVKDHIDPEDETAWVSFTLKGRTIKFDCKFNDDWIDDRILTRLNEMLQQEAPSKTFVYYDLKGQDCVLGCFTNEQLKQLNKHGIDFVPLR